MTDGPRLFSILRQSSYLIASIHTALDDSQLMRFKEDLVQRIGHDRARGVVVDVAALDVLDSYASRTLRDIGEMARLRGAATVIVGIQPEVAFAMVQLGMNTGSVVTALDLEEGIATLDRALAAPAMVRLT
ncbi:MAG: STAS domain-containing protein [Geodermatophilales bacterium]|nr:STAS domain-containing protein [Geodermatophilales bacterium]